MRTSGRNYGTKVAHELLLARLMGRPANTGGIVSVESYVDGANRLLALVVRSDFKSEGIEFFTDSQSSQQLGYMRRPAGYEVAPHRHNEVRREVRQTQEVLFIRSGSCRLDLYSDSFSLYRSLILDAGDVVLLSDGGHGLVMLDETEIIEVKQGPYSGDEDKTRFIPELDK